MNDQIKQLTTDELKKILNFVNQTASFAKEQMPILCQEIVHWGIWSNIVWGIGGIAVLALGILLFYFSSVLLKKDKDDDFAFFLALAAILAIICAIILVLISSYDAIYVYVAPRLYIIDYLKDLTN